MSPIRREVPAHVQDEIPLLIVIPNVAASTVGEDLILDIKAVEGLSLFATLWPGKVRAIFRLSSVPPSYSRRYTSAQLTFDVVTVAADASIEVLAPYIDARAGPAIIMAGADDYREFDLGLVVRPNLLVYMIEYDFATRYAILKLDPIGLLRKARRLLWLSLRERERRVALRRADGIQANGGAAFKAYAALSSNALLYFDTRLGRAQFIGDRIQCKTQEVLANHPLHLAFSGRLERMKGADHLVAVARLLQRSGMLFNLDIWGDGSLMPELQDEVKLANLVNIVKFHGSKPFDNHLIPAMRDQIDLFVCCHRQADPSCTYMETLGCGVPIVGYLNDAFASILSLGSCGVGVTLGDVAGMAGAIAALDSDRSRLASLMRGAATVAASHLFEDEFEARINHLRKVAGVG